jgi:hypothetical protein
MRTLAAALALCFALDAQDAQQPAEVQFTISTAKTTFYLGEAIPVELRFTAGEPNAFVANTGLSEEQFTADPAASVDTRRRGRIITGPLATKPLSTTPLSIEETLNEELRFQKPGIYRVYATSYRVTRLPAGPGTHITPLKLVSNSLTLQILEPPPGWISEQIAGAKKELDAAGDNNSERLRATRALRVLDTPEAAAELARRLANGQNVDTEEAWRAMMESPYRAELLPVLEQMLSLPARAVTTRDLDMLGQVADMEEAARRPGLRDSKRLAYAARLNAAALAKQPQARVASLKSAVEVGSLEHLRPSWLPAAGAALAADFRLLAPFEQWDLLERCWDALEGPAIIPALRAIVENPPPSAGIMSTDAVAMRRLYEVAPEEARQIILDEIRNPTRRLSFQALAILPDESRPELNDVLAARRDSLLILRYATGDVVKRVERDYLAHSADLERQKLPYCAGPLVFYFLKYDPPFGERLLRADFDRTNAAPVCYDLGSQFRDLGRWAYSPALEKLAIEYLTSPKLPVKRGAAEILGKYGSAAAEKPLWDTLEYFRNWWKGREQEMSWENSQFEATLRNALARSSAWTLDAQDLERLLSLCTSAACRQDVNRWIEERRSGSGTSLPHP